MNKKLVLIDGHSILNRAFYGVPALSNSEGIPTNAVYGFLNILFKILDEEKPEYLAVAFDVKAPTFRHNLYQEYKGTRKGMPEELRVQVPMMKEMLTAMGILIMEKEGLEADDILGTFAKRAEAENVHVTLVSGDRDLLQVASKKIKIRIPKTKGGKTEIEDYYEEDVIAKYQVTPAQFIDLKALMGDTADNIPGVPKVGPKTATELMVSYGSLENIYLHLEEISKKSVRETLRENRHLADLSKVLATIEINGDIPYTLSQAEFKDPFTKDAYVICKRYEFKNLLSHFEAENVVKDNKSCSFYLVSSLSQADEVFDKALKTNKCGFSVLEDSSKEEDFSGISLCLSEEETYVFPAQGDMTKQYLTDKLRKLSEKVRLITFHIKKQYSYLVYDDVMFSASLLGICRGEKADSQPFDEKGAFIKYFDCLIGAYLCNPLKNDYSISDIANEYLGRLVPDRNELLGKLSLKNALIQKIDVWKEYAGSLSLVPYLTEERISERLKETGMWELFQEIEMPLSYVLYDMEKEGVKVEKESLKEYGSHLAEKIEKLEESIYRQAGERFNLNSPKQLGEVLFGKLNMPGGKKTKTGYSTAAEVLDKLAPEYPIVAEILEYRTLAKLKSTYADGLATCIGEDGRIHTSFNQTITATGRISSTEPNLQNIPMRMELGRLIRKVFIPKEGYIFADADYSQIELRLLAHMSGDEGLIEAYRTDADIHKITASQVFHIPMDEVTDLQRRNAKAVNFGIVYGISSFGLSQDLSITVKEAGDYIEKYFQTYPCVKEFLNNTVSKAREEGYVSTIFGRRRPIPELSSKNFMQRSFGERVAMNSPLQGTAADIMKIAMIRIFNRLKKDAPDAKMLLQVHDEILIEARKEDEELVKMILEEEMKNAASLKVALEVDIHTGSNWYEAK